MKYTVRYSATGYENEIEAKGPENAAWRVATFYLDEIKSGLSSWDYRDGVEVDLEVLEPVGCHTRIHHVRVEVEFEPIVTARLRQTIEPDPDAEPDRPFNHPDQGTLEIGA